MNVWLFKFDHSIPVPLSNVVRIFNKRQIVENRFSTKCPLNTTTLWRTRTIVWDWSYIADCGNFQTSCLQSTDCSFTPRTWTLNFNFNSLHTVFHSLLGSSF